MVGFPYKGHKYSAIDSLYSCRHHLTNILPHGEKKFRMNTIFLNATNLLKLFAFILLSTQYIQE